MALGSLQSYLIYADQAHDDVAKGERWYVDFAIPKADWPANWSIVPDRGDAPPALPAKLNIQGVCLRRRVLFEGMPGGIPGYVLIKLTYGFDFASIGENKALVTGRTILVQQEIEYAYTGAGNKTLVKGPVDPVATGHPIIYEHDITPGQGYDRFVEIPFQQVRLSAILNAQGLIDFVGPLMRLAGGLNSAQWTLLGDQTIAIDQMMFRGGTWGLYSNAPSARLYRADFDWLIHPWVWHRTLQTTKFERVAMGRDLVGSTGTVTGARSFGGRLAVANATTDNVDLHYRKSYDFASLLNGIIVT